MKFKSGEEINSDEKKETCEDSKDFAKAVPVLQGETEQTICNAPGPRDAPSPLLAAANQHGLWDDETRREYRRRQQVIKKIALTTRERAHKRCWIDGT